MYINSKYKTSIVVTYIVAITVFSLNDEIE